MRKVNYNKVLSAIDIAFIMDKMQSVFTIALFSKLLSLYCGTREDPFFHSGLLGDVNYGNFMCEKRKGRGGKTCRIILESFQLSKLKIFRNEIFQELQNEKRYIFFVNFFVTLLKKPMIILKYKHQLNIFNSIFIFI